MEFFGVDVSDMTIPEVQKLFRRHDESNLFPICGRLNVTEKAIRRINKAMRAGIEIADGYEYALALDKEISLIVNSEC